MSTACRITVEDVGKLSPAAQRVLKTARVEMPTPSTAPTPEQEATLEYVIKRLPLVDRSNLKHVAYAIDYIIRLQEDIEDIRK